MLDFIKFKIKSIMIPLVYFASFGIFPYSIFKRAEIGLWLMVFLIPQPNIWRKFYTFYLGYQYMDFLFFSILLGIIIQNKFVFKHENTFAMLAILSVTYFSLWTSAFRFSLPMPISTVSQDLIDYKNYAQMILMYFLVVNIVKTEAQRNLIILILVFAICIMVVRSFRNFNPGTVFDYSKRASGPFYIVKLNANHWGAFVIHYAAFILGLIYYEKNKKRKLFFIITALFCLHPIFFTYSRGVYVAAIFVLIFFGVLKDRKILLVLFILIISWNTLLPPSVVDRISMTETKSGKIEHSAGGRLEMWGLAFDLFTENPIIGAGFQGFSRTFGGRITKGGLLAKNQDVHNFYMRTLCEQGIIGILIFLFILFRAFRSGWILFKNSLSPSHSGIALGFMGCVIAITFTNMFGDRWSYFVMGSYFWCLWGVVDSIIENNYMDVRAVDESASLV